jgi:16S rRNA (guanine527-N7)-methyltransferase
MPDDTTTELLVAVLATIRERGPIGEASLVAAVQRADAFVALVPSAAQHVVDLGSGGGLPGLVIAARRADLMVTLVERRRTRADLLERAVRALGVSQRVRVSSEDAERLAQRVPGSFDVATARSFGPPDLTLRLGSALVRPGGLVLIAEPPEELGDRWSSGTLLSECEVVDQGRHDGVRSFLRS